MIGPSSGGFNELKEKVRQNRTKREREKKRKRKEGRKDGWISLDKQENVTNNRHNEVSHFCGTSSDDELGTDYDHANRLLI